MTTSIAIPDQTRELSATARDRMLSVRGEPLFYADWPLSTVFVHFEVDPDALQREVPFEVDLHEGRAYISLVAFTMRDMRPRFGGRLGALLFKPISTHPFLNVRAYVRHRGEPGIYFLAEWLSNRLSVRLGPPLFGLPYRLGRLQYDHQHEFGILHGIVTDSNGRDAALRRPDSAARCPYPKLTQPARLEYTTNIAPSASFHPCHAGTLDEFLLERYTAFTMRAGYRKAIHSALRTPHSEFGGLFRIWHPPWPQIPIEISLQDTGLLTQTWPWFADARLIGANYSPGIHKVWMGWLQKNLRNAFLP